jgi:hypothetical protein
MAAHDDNSTEPTVLSHAIPALELISGGLQRRRRRIFTPSAINTIRRLAAQGKSASQIAEVIGSTSASVRVKCCLLKIKLRRRHAPQISGQSLVVYLHAADYAALKRKAADMQKSASELSGELLTAIIRSDIYEAVLDDDRQDFEHGRRS